MIRGSQLVIFFALGLAVIFGVNVAIVKFFPRGSATVLEVSSVREKPVGKKLHLDGLDWNRAQKTVVFYLSSSCRYCTESGPYYRRLVANNLDSNSFRFIAILPQPTEMSKDYLNRMNLSVNDIFQAELDSIGVVGTPTIMLVNEFGVILNVWTGKLSNDGEREVLSVLSTK
jgi:hypothetical protein